MCRAEPADEVGQHGAAGIRKYKRHGTQCLIAAFDVATGEIQGTVGDTRTEDDYVNFLEGLFASSRATTQWRVICDNLNTHVLGRRGPPGGPVMRDRD